MKFCFVFWCAMNNRFKELRKTLKLKQDEIAKILNKSTRMIQYYEQGKFDIETDLLFKLQELYNVNLNWLITGTGSMFLEEKKDDNKYQWLINTLNKLPEEDVKQIELEAQKILEEQYNKEMNINPTKRIG